MPKDDNTKLTSDLSEEELRKEIARVELETKQLQLAEAKQRNADFKEKEAQRHRANQQRMKELEDARNNHHSVIRQCRHKSGGSPKNILRGGGKNAFSLLTRALMPDGVTILLQCSRCRLKFYTPEKDKRQLWFKKFDEELRYYQKLLETSIEDGLEHAEMRGPTFMFQKEGVPFVPERR